MQRFTSITTAIISVAHGNNNSIGLAIVSGRLGKSFAKCHTE